MAKIMFQQVLPQKERKTNRSTHRGRPKGSLKRRRKRALSRRRARRSSFEWDPYFWGNSHDIPVVSTIGISITALGFNDIATIWHVHKENELELPGQSSSTT